MITEHYSHLGSPPKDEGHSITSINTAMLITRIIQLLTVIYLVGCSNVYIQEPLVKEGSDGVDYRLLGEWGPFEGDSGTDNYWLVKKHPEGGMEITILTGAIPSFDDSVRCYAETWNDTQLLSIQVQDKDNSEFREKHGANFALAEYVFEDEEVSVWVPTKKAIQELVESNPQLVVGIQKSDHKIDCVLNHEPKEILGLWESISQEEKNWIEVGVYPKAK